MKHNKQLVLSTLALSIMAVTSASSAASQGTIKQINKVKAPVFQQAQMETLSFAEWQNREKAKKRDFTDRLIIKYKNDLSSTSRQDSLASNKDVDVLA